MAVTVPPEHDPISQILHAEHANLTFHQLRQDQLFEAAEMSVRYIQGHLDGIKGELLRTVRQDRAAAGWIRPTHKHALLHPGSIPAVDRS